MEDERIEKMDRRIEAFEGRMHQVESTVARLSAGVEKNNLQTQEMYEVFAAARGGFQTLELIGKGARPVLWIAALLSAVLIGAKTGVWKLP